MKLCPRYLAHAVRRTGAEWPENTETIIERGGFLISETDPQIARNHIQLAALHCEAIKARMQVRVALLLKKYDTPEANHHSPAALARG